MVLSSFRAQSAREGSQISMRSTARLFLLPCLALLLLALGCGRAEERPEEFRIGLLAPLSNPVRFNAHDLAAARVAEINAQGGLAVAGRKIPVRLVIVDSGNQIEQTMNVAAQLAQQERVSAIIGPYYSREAIPVGGAMDKFQVPLLSPSATSPLVTQGRQFVFRVCQVDTEHGRAMARYAYNDLGLRRAAVLYDESDAYSSGLAANFRDAFAENPGARIHLEFYPTGAQDFTALLERIRLSGAQALFLPNFTVDLSRQLQQARAQGFEGVFLGGDSWDTDQGFHDLPEAQGAVYSTDFAPAAADAQRLGAAQALAAKAGVTLIKNAALTLDALDLLFAAAQAAGSTEPVALRSALAGLRGVQGLSGSISYAGTGDPERPLYLLGITGGRGVLRARLHPQTSAKGAL